MTRKPTAEPARKPHTAAKAKAAPSVAKPSKAATGQAGGYIFQIGPTKSAPGSRLKGAGK